MAALLPIVELRRQESETASSIQRFAFVRYLVPRALVIVAVVLALAYLQLNSESYSVANEVIAHSYRALGLEPGADTATIKRAARRLAALHHPDQDKSPEAAARYIAIQAAAKNLLRKSPSGALYDPESDSGLRVQEPEHAGPRAERVHIESYSIGHMAGSMLLMALIASACCGRRKDAAKSADGAAPEAKRKK
eukprot:a843835_37.p1 GENE.a843835_37~~a843835_37.p1  ORF type:complete len:209 (-),score=55.60 a843835_37:4-585(-)